MKRASLLSAFGCAAVLALGGCAAVHSLMPPDVPVAPPIVTPAVAPAPSGVETIPFHTGVSSATVEKMAKQQGCTGGEGAGLITEPGPVEVYRMRCEDGRTFKARCELRQCRQM